MQKTISALELSFPWQRDERIIEARFFDFRMLGEVDVLEKQRKQGGEKRRYLNCVCSFDIETTNIREIKQAVMYVWQFALGHQLVVVGRTWEEYLLFLQGLRRWVPEGVYLVCYVHNLSFEFQFLRGIYSFEPQEVFAIEKRSILRCDMLHFVEYRCSMKLSNYGLDAWTSVMRNEHHKESGEDFDYSILRWPWTPLTPKEYKYCVYDVLAVVECVELLMAAEGDNLATIPMTQTGYIRREVKEALRVKGPFYVKNLLPTFELFQLLRKAFRGGNTHCNRYYTGLTVHGVYSADRSSSYPDVMCNCLFPTGKFCKALPGKNPIDLITDGWAVVFSFQCWGLRLKEKYWGFPYISKDKFDYSPNVEGEQRHVWEDNGRIIKADYVAGTVTDIDFHIIDMEYTYDSISFDGDIWFARYGSLPDEFTSVLKRHYRVKTTMKGTINDGSTEYQRSKEKLNAGFGMAAQNPLKDTILFALLEEGQDFYSFTDLRRLEAAEKLTDKEKEELKIETLDEAELYAQAKPTLPYQWGVWVTAQARYELELAMWKLQEHDGPCRLIYIDTDSLYYEGPRMDFSDYNDERIRRAKKNDAWAIDGKGKPHYMGVLEEDPPIDRFKSEGAKKYIYERDGNLKITVAGVQKSAGAKELLQVAKENSVDAFDAFSPGLTFRSAGGVAAWYNDRDFGQYEVGGECRSVYISSNIFLAEDEYTLSLTPDYMDIVEQLRRNPNFCEEVLDIWHKSVYNKINRYKIIKENTRDGNHCEIP